MKRICLSVALCCATLLSPAQKATVEDDKIIVDGKPVATIARDGCGAVSPSCSFYIGSLDGSPLITVTGLLMTDASRTDASSQPKKLRYLRLSFTGIDGVAEIANPSLLATKSKDVAQSVMRAQLIRNGALDPDAVRNFIRSNGTRFSDRERATTPKTIIVR